MGKAAKKRVRFEAVLEQERWEQDGWCFVVGTRLRRERMGIRVELPTIWEDLPGQQPEAEKAEHR